MSEFYTIETPPPSSSTITSKDSSDESLLTFSCSQRLKYLSNNRAESMNQQQSNAILLQPDEFGSSATDDNHTPLRRSLGNTKLKTRQDVRRFRKFLKRNYDLSSISLIDIEPDTMRQYLIDYLTSIRTRKGLKYDPETLRSYYLSIQRYLKDSNYSYCLRSSPQFAQCRDLIIQMRKEKNQIKIRGLSSTFSGVKAKKKETTRKRPTPVNFDVNDDKQNNRMILSDPLITIPSKTCLDLLPSSSLPPRKRQQMKYFLESRFSCDFLFLSSIPRSLSPPLSSLSSDAYFLLTQFVSTRPYRTDHFEHLLDQSPACGKEQRLMLTSLCQQWTGDIRLIHANLRPEINSFLPHILVLNILSSKYS